MNVTHTHAVAILPPGEQQVALMGYGETILSLQVRIPGNTPDEAWVGLSCGLYVRLGFLRAVYALQLMGVLP
jgi:hypothetical protein